MCHMHTLAQQVAPETNNIIIYLALPNSANHDHSLLEIISYFPQKEHQHRPTKIPNLPTGFVTFKWGGI